jgi:hypothetical protein
MRFLRRRQRTDEARPRDVEAEAVACEHVTLVPGWDNARDVGRVGHASLFRCEACRAEFTPDKAAELRETEAARIQRRMAS